MSFVNDSLLEIVVTIVVSQLLVMFPLLLIFERRALLAFAGKPSFVIVALATDWIMVGVMFLPQVQVIPFVSTLRITLIIVASLGTALFALMGGKIK